MDLQEKARHIPCTSFDKCLAKWSSEIKAFPAQKSVIYNVTIKQCKINQPSLGMSSFATQTVGTEKAVVYQYGIIHHGAMSSGSGGRPYEKETLVVSPQYF